MPDNYWIGSTGSQSWAVASNWSLGRAPIVADNVYIINGSSDINVGLNADVLLTLLTIGMGFTGTIGLPEQTPASITGITRVSTTATATTSAAHGYANGDKVTVSGALEAEYNGTFTISNVASTTFDYTVTGTPTTPAGASTKVAREYDYLYIGATTATIGEPATGGSTGSGSGRIKIDFRTSQTTINVRNTGSTSTDTNAEPLRILASHASNVLYVAGGRVGIGTTRPGQETGIIPTIGVTGGIVTIEKGIDWTAITNNGGTVIVKGAGAASTITNTSGTVATFGTELIGTIFAGGQTNLGHRVSGAASVTDLSILSGGSVDVTTNPALIIITNTINMYEGSSLRAFSPGQIQKAAGAAMGIRPMQCGVEDVTINVGDNPLMTIAA